MLASIRKKVRIKTGSQYDAANPSCNSPKTSRCFAMSAWLVKTRRASSRHCRDARVYGHTATAMHDISTSPRPPLCLFDNSFRDGGNFLNHDCDEGAAVLNGGKTT